MENIISITDAAVTHIKKLMQEEKSTVGFRLSLKKTGCSGYSYVPEIAKEVRADDLYFTAQEGLPVYIDPASKDFLKDTLVDYIEDTKTGLKQKRLVFINEKEKTRCGCGESFTIE